jgi:oxysterol-binding protein-related protein 9/10/11
MLTPPSTAARLAADNQEDSTSSPPPSSDEVRVSYLTEQTSHHPPVSAFFVDCPARGISARGFDQLSAKFTGTTIRVTPGAHNLGIFITLAQRDNEEYQLTHPAAQLGGILRGALSVSVSDVCFVTCPKTRIKVILHYIEEGWLGKSQNRVQGVMFRYDPANDKYSRIKDVPPKDILVNIEGCWQEQVYYSIPPTAAVKNGKDSEASSKELLVDLSPMLPVPKTVPPEEDQLPTESRRFWKDVTNAILNKQYGEATRLKQALEQRQRDRAEERKAKKEEWQPKFFTGAVMPKGRPELNEEGQAVLKGIHEGSYKVNDAGDMWA